MANSTGLPMNLATPDISSTQDSSQTQCPQTPCNNKQEKQTFESSSDCQKSFKPPPPPPPPPCVTYFPSSSQTFPKSSKTPSCIPPPPPPCPPRLKGKNNSTKGSPPPPPPPYVTFFPSSSHSPPKSSKAPSSSIPPPPFPPPFSKGNKNSANGPPPPPSQPPQSTPLGKYAAPLPKLKPFHWDKVKAAPNQPMVWDMLPHSFK